MQQMARYVGSITEDGSTLQIGRGSVTNEALKHLADRCDLGIHSDAFWRSCSQRSARTPRPWNTVLTLTASTQLL
jgi:acyl-CoA hydrolase